MAPETPAQRKRLDKIAVLAAEIEAEDATLKAKRNKLRELFIEARADDTSSYAIAKAANLSQPRVMQIIKRGVRL